LAGWPEALEEFRQVYNERRPHEALGMQRPAERYRASVRGYQAAPPEWEYPSGSLLRQLNVAGCLTWEGKRWFVCEALAGRWVRIEKIENLLLVSYRHMYVREINRSAGNTRPLVRPREVGRAGRSPSGLPSSPANPPNAEAQV
jgi:putative transposase